MRSALAAHLWAVLFEFGADRITARYGQAYDAWQAAMAKAVRATTGVDLPDRPDL